MVGYDHPFLRRLRDEAYARPKSLILLVDCKPAAEAAYELQQNGYAEVVTPISLERGLDMLVDGVGEAFVAGANTDTADVARAIIRRKLLRRDVRRMTSTSVLCFPDGTTLFYADTGLAHIVPKEITLEQIAAMTEETARAVGFEPVVAYIGHRTEGNTVQYDAAIDPEVARRKNAIVQGNANIMIFPSIEVANPIYKAVQRHGNAAHMGPVFQGLTKPCSDLSRGADVDEIVNTVLFVSKLVRASRSSP